MSALADSLEISTRYNDLYHWTTSCARALLVHQYSNADLDDALGLVEIACSNRRPGFVSRNFDGVFFTRNENLELDGLLEVVEDEGSSIMRDLVFYGVAQAALAKMPMSMFHRPSLKQRLRRIARRSYNVKIWNTAFAELVPEYVAEAVHFAWRRKAKHSVTIADATRVGLGGSSEAAVFLDPPYISHRGAPSYAHAYHFLEGFAVGSAAWQESLDTRFRMPVFRGAKESCFDSREGWVHGMTRILHAVRSSTVLATARQRDNPGARVLHQMLTSKFASVRRKRVLSSTIFSDSPNEEYLFVAAD